MEVMKADHDLNMTVIDGSLAVIRGRYNIPVEYGLHAPRPGQRPYSSDAPGMCITVDALEAGLWFPLHPLIEEYRMDLDDLRRMPKMSSGKAPSTHAAALAQEVDVSPAREAPKTSSKRPIDAPTEQADDLAQRHKKVKVLMRRHKSRHGEGESRSHSMGKEPAAPSEELDTSAESDEGDASEKELNEVRSNLAEIQRLLKEAWVRAQKMDDELLQVVKALENARVELPRQAVDRYKESVGFKEGLKRMGRVTYEYGYQVALARFHALHLDSEVEEDPFTIHSEDDLVPKERQQTFDDSDPPES
ncbi:hypothetical protein B296_00040785 [Ensete ventricosum]|uniref:Uncharacterized protein n=1 Tax=Ensete ventricosum TaxID=4639 RepID=A0A426X997_ENSVE|nr:hypothetical protein B296_00040785 [Ensete ventricosum]